MGQQFLRPRSQSAIRGIKRSGIGREGGTGVSISTRTSRTSALHHGTKGGEPHMGEVVGAAIVAHVPTIMLPEQVRFEINDGKEILARPGPSPDEDRLPRPLKPDTIVVMDTHWDVTFEHIVTSENSRKGVFTSHELPRGMSQIDYDMPGDPEFAHAVEKEAAGPRRHLGAGLRRPLPAHPIRHREHLVLPERRGTLGFGGHQPVCRYRRLPVVGGVDRQSDRGSGQTCCASRLRRHVAPVPSLPGAAGP